MSKTKYYLREKANPSHLITADWQNASELVSHGFWEWAKPDGSKSTGQREFSVAQREAKTGRPPEGFYDAAPEVATSAGDDESDDADVVVEPLAQVVEAVKEVVQASAPAAPTAPVPMDLEDMTIEELREHASSLGVVVDRRVGTKNLIAQIKSATEK